MHKQKAKSEQMREGRKEKKEEKKLKGNDKQEKSSLSLSPQNSLLDGECIHWQVELHHPAHRIFSSCET